MENLFGILHLIFRTIRFGSYYMSHVMDAINPIPLRTILLIILEADEAVYHERHNITTLTALLKPFFFGFSTNFIFSLIFSNSQNKDLPIPFVRIRPWRSSDIQSRPGWPKRRPPEWKYWGLEFLTWYFSQRWQ